ASCLRQRTRGAVGTERTWTQWRTLGTSGERGDHDTYERELLPVQSHGSPPSAERPFGRRTTSLRTARVRVAGGLAARETENSAKSAGWLEENRQADAICPAARAAALRRRSSGT